MFSNSLNLSPKAKVFYTRLKIYANRDNIVDGKSYESLGITRNMVKRVLKELQDLGLIEIISRQGKKKTIVYKLID